MTHDLMVRLGQRWMGHGRPFDAADGLLGCNHPAVRAPAPAYCRRRERARSGPTGIGVWMALCLMLFMGTADAGGFSILVSPPRFELRTEPGKVLRQVVEVNNVSTAPSPLSIQTAEWRYGSDGSLQFDNALAEGSCRPWVAIEARELKLGNNARKRFRFEVAVPPDAPSQECRFALLFEGAPEAVGNLAVPVSGRIAVIVYVAVGNISPRLEIARIGTADMEGRKLPSVAVTNRGTGTTRLEGFVSGRDARGQEFVLAPQNFPILPGQTRTIVLVPDVAEGQTAPAMAYPVTLSGRLEWGGESMKIDQRVEN